MKMCRAFTVENGRYIAVVLSSPLLDGQILWRSKTKYDTPDDALKAADQQLANIMRLTGSDAPALRSE